MFVKPTAGRVVPDPDRRDHLPPEGRQVEPTQYWQRRILDGDVTEATPPQAAPTAPSKTRGNKE